MILIGLTGGVATGKSTVAKMFRRLGVPTVDTDELAHYLMRKGTSEHNKIVKLFGPEVIKKNGDIDRRKIADMVFKTSLRSNMLRKKLEKILHPPIWRIVKSLAGKLKKKSGLFVAEVPLLFEVGWDKKVDWTVAVICSHNIESQRCKGHLKNRIKMQMPLSIKAQMADFVIDSSYGRKETFRQVKALLKAFDKARLN